MCEWTKHPDTWGKIQLKVIVFPAGESWESNPQSSRSLWQGTDKGDGVSKENKAKNLQTFNLVPTTLQKNKKQAHKPKRQRG